MDPVGASLSNDVHNNQTHRQSILGSFLRVRPRGTSQSHQNPSGPFNPLVDHENNGNGSSNINNPQQQGAGSLSDHGIAAILTNGGVNGGNNTSMPIQPPSPGAAGHRRRPAAGGAGALQTSNSATHSFGINIAPSSTGNVSMHGLSQMLRRRRSANGALSSSNPSAMGANSPVDAHGPASALPVNPRAQPAPPPTNANPNSNARSHRIRLVPHLDTSRSLHFEPICRDVREGDSALRIGRFTDRSGMGVSALNAQNTNKLAFKSKVVSRAHAEVWCETNGKFYIRDTKSSSGTFLNHIRLSAPNTDSKPFPIKDGDVLQLGVDYQGGTEEIYKCVKMRIELGREWQSQPNAFNTNALKQLKTLAAQPIANKPGPTKGSLPRSGIPDCCICLFGVTVHQALFIAPCSHVFHYKCIRPMLLMHHPGFSCPLCRTFANLDEDVEIDTEDFGQDVDTDGDVPAAGTGASSGAEGVAIPQSVPAITNTNADANLDSNAMDVDPIVSVANDFTARMHAAGAETEVERDFAPPNIRRRNNNTNNAASNNGNAGVAARNNYPSSVSPTRSGIGYFEGLLEDVDEYLSVASDEVVENNRSSQEQNEIDDSHPLPALPVPTANGRLPVPSVPAPSSTNSVSGGGGGAPTSAIATSAPGQMQGLAIQRPRSVPLPPPSQNVPAPALTPAQVAQVQQQQRMSPLNDGMSGMSDGDEEEGEDELGTAIRGAGVGMTVGVGGDRNASGSSGEGVGPLGMIGEKRKR